MDFIWQSAILILAGIILLKIAGRKSISQLTLAQTVVMLSIGMIIVQPVVQNSLIKTILVSAFFISSVVVLEYMQVKSNAMEKFITGKAKLIIKNGEIDPKVMRKLRFTVDQLEMRLRIHGVSNLDDIKNATLEVNGELGYELKDDAKPLTVGEFKKLMEAYFPGVQQGGLAQGQKEGLNLFDELDGEEKKDNGMLQ
ncbi:DUF421 domain-containing protein [Neobacillus piezotolerans]|uniref:DUF421 domain-containing protein n=1 Tax=Neobacillus piezotolerans TaxID=2259171 RepID=A0A3D8GWQ7_9BACI|nr:YetF domain-containing protein [Neobacillus piezotolerans]RDU38875.1 DUF421 domain-containing protein [Neobacillus piezotolerans]